MPLATLRDANTGGALPDRRKMRISIRLISQHGTPLPPMIRAQALWILQDGNVWRTSAIEETVGAMNKSSRDFLVQDGPMGQSMTPIEVVMGLEDDKGATYLLALRHQRIGAVE